MNIRLIVLLALAALSAAAQNMAVIDMQGAILNTTDGRKASMDLKAKYDPIQQSITKRSQELAAKQAQYRKAAETMSDEAKAKAEREIQDLGKALQRDADDAKAEATADQNKMLSPILQRLETIMRKYAADKQISMIVDLTTQPNNLMFSAASVNITADVIALYNNQVPPAAGPAAAKPGATTNPAAPKPTAPAAKPR